MNKCVLCGRLTKDPEVRTSQSGVTTARYSLAVDRRGRQEQGEQTADFINCVAFGKGAEFAEKYLRKGIKILVEGHIQTGSYTNREGQRVYTTDVIIETHEFVEPKQVASPEPDYHSGYGQQERATVAPMGNGFVSNNPEQMSMDDFMPLPDDVSDDGLPFA